MSNIDELIGTMDGMQDDLEDLLVNRKFNTFGKVALEQEILKKSGINELINIGLGQSYTLKSITITKVEESVYNQGELLPFIDMIVNGLGLLKLAAQVPFFSKYIEQVSQLLISDGITQIAANILNQKIDTAYLVSKVLNSLEVTIGLFDANPCHIGFNSRDFTCFTSSLEGIDSTKCKSSLIPVGFDAVS